MTGINSVNCRTETNALYTMPIKSKYISKLVILQSEKKEKKNEGLDDANVGRIITIIIPRLLTLASQRKP